MMKKSLLLACCLLLAGAGGAEADAARAIRAHAPGTAFQQGEALRFTLNPGFPHPEQWILRDWRGTELRRGQWPADGLLLEALPNGYYLLAVESAGASYRNSRSFAVVPDARTRKHNPDSFFALDSAQSWLAAPDSRNVLHPGEGFETVSELARRAGTLIVRERLRWEDCEPAPGKVQWGRYMRNAELLAERGVQISGMYHDAPRWAKKESAHYPDDLVATYRFAKTAAEAFRGKMTVWEFWNEPDHGSVPEPPWDFASAYKAACLGFKAGAPGIPVMNGGFAITMPHPHMDIVLNNAADYIDIFNVHTYMPLRDFPAAAAELRKLLARHNMTGCPVWFTENGSEMEGAARLDSELAGVKAHSPEQEMILAEFLPKSMISLQSLGIDRDFFFVLPPYNERRGAKDWGLLRRDYSVKPGYVAFATLTDQLGAAEFQGTMPLGEGVRGYLYRLPDGTQTLVYWSLSPLDTERNQADPRPGDRFERKFSLPIANGRYRKIDIFGTPAEVRAENRSLALTADRLPAFLTGLSGLKPKTPFRKPQQAARPASDADLTVIYRVKLSEDFLIPPARDRIDPRKENAAFKLQIFNLSEERKAGTVHFPGAEVSGLPERIVLEPFARAEFELGITPGLNRDFCGELRVEGAFNGRKTTPLVIPVVSQEKMLAAARGVPLVRTADPAGWRANSSGRMVIRKDAGEQAVCFTVDFPPNVDRWVYPEFVLDPPKESLKNAIGISFEVKVFPADKVSQMLVMGVAGTEKEHGRTFHFPVTKPPAEQWEKRAVSLLDGNAAPADIRQLRIGLNSRADRITYQLRNIRILYRQ